MSRSPEDHYHLAAVHLRLGFYLRDIFQFERQPVQNIRPQVLATKFPSSKANGHLNLVPVTDELPHITLLELIIMGIDRRAHPDFLECEGRLIFFGFSLFLAFLELELPIIHDLAYRRLSQGADFYEIQIPLSGELQCRFNIHYADLPFIVDNPYLFRFNKPYLVVYAGLVDDPPG